MNDISKKIIQPSSASERTRPPVVVVMGHVDHGKTTLLDKIREMNIPAKEPSTLQVDRFYSVVDGESGGITQHVGAYEVEVPQEPKSRESETHQGIPRQTRDDFAIRKITFLDTPGHEAFSKMRARGAKVADVAILVVAADEGVKPQTKEAISHILESKTPMVVALNKIDRPGANPDRVKQELASENVLVEGWGGNVPSIEISAKKGQGIDELLELILLIAEIENLVADPAAKAEGIVIESQLEKKRGLASTLLVKNGTLKKGDSVLAGSAFAKIKLLENFKGESISEAGPSMPAQVLGWESLPQVGDTFQSGKEQELRALALEIQKLATLKEKETGDLMLAIKADVTGSLEALEGAIQALPKDDLRVVIISSDVGEITESDIKLAYATNALIIGFRARMSREGEVLIKQYPCKILQSDIIYEVLEMLEQEIKNIAANKKTASLRSQLEVLAVFGEKGSRQVIGGRVSEKPLEKRMTMKIVRKNTEIGKVKILNLQQEKRDISKVDVGNECGAFIDGPITVATGDILIEIKNEKD